MDLSPPPTPPSRPPTAEEQRFKSLTTPCEWIEDYYPGSYHPIHFGDTFQDGRYTIVRKLGDGSFSTVWLARDRDFKRYVAMKILKAKATAESNEIKMLWYLSQCKKSSFSDSIVQLLDQFKHTGPNGIHTCLVFEPMGPSVSSMVEDLEAFKKYRPGVKVRYPVWMAKRILNQVLCGLVFLHQNGVAHGDLQCGNMLFTVKDLGDVEGDKLKQDEKYKWGSISPPVERKDGKVDKWAPRYLAVPQPLDEFADIDKDFRIKLSDMGAAYFISDPPATVVTPQVYRTPECVLLEGQVDSTLDVWAFGCLIYELLIGFPLFQVDSSRDKDIENDHHLLLFSDILGPLPDHLYSFWTRSSRYYTSERVLFNTFLEEVPEGTDLLSTRSKSLEELFDEQRPDMSDNEAKQINALLRRILQYDPAKRPTPAELLKDPWFTG